MGPTTISLDEDAYERLTAEKREDESFSDVVRRLTAGIDLADYHGVLSSETGDALTDVIAGRRREDAEARSIREEQVTEAMENPDEGSTVDPD